MDRVATEILAYGFLKGKNRWLQMSFGVEGGRADAVRLEGSTIP